MLLRQLVTHWLKTQAAQKAREEVMKAAQQHVSGETDPDQPEDQPPAPCDIGVVFALSIEAGGLLDKLEGVVSTQGFGFTAYEGGLNGRTVVLMESGPGREKAAQATTALIEGHKPAWVISAGFAGGLIPECERNDIIVADQVVLLEGGQLSIEMGMPRQPHLHVGRLLTVDEIVEEPEEKQRLAHNHAAIAVDMETYAVAEVCAAKKTRFLSLRVISDGIEDRLPPEIENLMHQKTFGGKLGAVAGSIFRRPGSVKDMWQLKERAIVASDTLAKFVAGIIAQLPRREPPAGAEESNVGDHSGAQDAAEGTADAE
jgi:adenosylhomocysteine nucleosidase